MVGHREKRGVCCKKIKKMALLSSFDMCPGELNINGYLAAPTSKYFLGFFLIEKCMHDQVERSSFESTKVAVAKTLLDFQPTRFPSS